MYPGTQITYKELKPMISLKNQMEPLRTQITYKELKPSLSLKLREVGHRTQITYKELKQFLTPTGYETKTMELRLPIRN